MQVILLERIAKLGQMGDVVNVKTGFARNFLLPRGKALRATDANRQVFEQNKAQLEARNLEARTEAEAVGEKLNGQRFVAIRSAGETGQLYGSVATRDIAEVVSEDGFSITRQQVRLDRPIKTIGIQTVTIALHPEVDVSVTLNVARSKDEAERQFQGEDLTQRDAFADDADLEEDAEVPNVEEIFESAELADALMEDEGEAGQAEAANDEAGVSSDDADEPKT